MSIVRVAKRARFTTIDRVTLNDDRLSFRARGVLSWLLDKPDDWSVRSEAIAEGGKEGRDAIRAALAELEVAGYVQRVKTKDDKGRWTTETVVYERPQKRIAAGHSEDGKPGDGKPGPGEPGPGNPGVGEPGATTNTETEDGERNLSRAEAAPPADIEIDGLEPFEGDFNKTWKHYPHKEARRSALRCYQARRRAGVDPAELHRATQIYRYVLDKTGRTPMNGSTFYGPNERWKDFLDQGEALLREAARGGGSGGGRPEPAPSRPAPSMAVPCPRCGGLVGGALNDCTCPTGGTP